MREELLKNKLVNALSGLIVLLTVVNLIITEILRDEIGKCFQRLESNVS